MPSTLQQILQQLKTSAVIVDANAPWYICVLPSWSTISIDIATWQLGSPVFASSLVTSTTASEPVDIIVCDASFIALAKVLEAPLELARPGASLVALVKPQFEAGRTEVGKGGVVRDPEVHERVCAEACAWIESRGWRVSGVTESPITGPEGNKEFLVGAVKDG